MNPSEVTETPKAQGSEGEFIPPRLAVKAMRDSGYKNTAYALAELIDNALQAKANDVEVFCVEERVPIRERERKRITRIAVLDNGTGMEPDTLRLALQFGNGRYLNDRSGIGRFGMGLPNSSISQCRRVDVWTWQAGPDNAIYTYLDVGQIEADQIRRVPEPQPLPVPSEWRDQAQGLGTTGTLIVWSAFDEHRLTWKGARATLDHTEALIGRIYRKFIHEGQADIRLVALEDGTPAIDRHARVNDPLYLLTPSSTPAPFNDKPMFQPWGEQHEEFSITVNGQTHTVTVRISWAKQETVTSDNTDRGSTKYGKHAAKNIGLSIVRARRELDLDPSWALSYDPRERWWGIEVEFPPELDEIFGVTNNKQAATIFSHMSQFDWETEAEPGEKYMDFKRRLEDEGDPRLALIDIVQYINDQLSKIRKRIWDQTKGKRSRGKRHDEPSADDAATTHWRARAEKGYTTEYDDQQLDEKTTRELKSDLVKNKYYPEEAAEEIVQAVLQRDRKVIFVTAESDSQAFFQVDPQPGGVTEVIFNTRHPAYEKLIRALDADVSEATGEDLVDRVENAATTLKLLLAAWARYEQEDVPSRDKIRDIRHEWGKMAKGFLTDE